MAVGLEKAAHYSMDAILLYPDSWRYYFRYSLWDIYKCICIYMVNLSNPREKELQKNPRGKIIMKLFNNRGSVKKLYIQLANNYFLNFRCIGTYVNSIVKRSGHIL